MAVELHLGEKRAGQFENFIGPTQILDLLGFDASNVLTHAGVHLYALNPFQQCLRHAAYLRRNRLQDCPQRQVTFSHFVSFSHQMRF